jgi:hypothetical protein
MSWSPLVDFYLKEHKAISEVIELERRALVELPNVVGKFLRSSIEQDIRNWKGFSDPITGFERHKDEVYVWWTDKTFYDDEVGPWFDIYITANSLLKPDPDDRPVLFMEFEGSPSKRKAFQKLMQRTDWKLKSSPWKEDSGYVFAWESIANVLTIDALDDQHELATAVCRKAKAFSEALVPICAKARERV